jgi:microcystin degradation protein MlrC
MPRVLIGGLSHETNTFNPRLTDRAAFERRAWLTGDALIDERRGTNSEIGGFIAGLSAAGVEIVPSAFAAAMPSGVVADVVLEAILDAILATLRRAPVDGLLLSLHGAMVTESHADAEGYLLARLRECVGRELPILVSLDLHATLTPEMAAHADGMVVYRTYPHMDLAERGEEAAELMVRVLRGDARPTVAIAKAPLLIGPPHNVLPTDEPMRSIMARAREMEREIPGVLAACPAHGFMQQDVPWAGVGAAVTTDGDPDLAQRLADELAGLLFAHRHDYVVDLPDAAEAVRQASLLAQKPGVVGCVAIADSGDNIGGGTPGDGAALLHEILRQGVTSAFVPLCDPEGARSAAAAGVGATVTLAVGGKSAPLYGPPVEITAQVRAITDGVYLNRAWGGYEAGIVADDGLSVRLDMGGITILLNSMPASPNNIMHAHAIGVYPEDYAMAVCKGGLAFREAYKPPRTHSYIQADTPGYSTSNLSLLTFRQVRRPIAPLDDVGDWRPGAQEAGG